jgi:hypothetical protein
MPHLVYFWMTLGSKEATVFNLHWCNSSHQPPMMAKAMFLKCISISIFTGLIAQEDFIAFTHRESFKPYMLHTIL